ncbi:MAG: prenyltransferase [Gemmataceae bacterium]|nr:prenyltransferase [Gemmataceae bacterium]
MLRFTFGTILALLLASSAFAQSPAKDRLTESVDRGLAFLTLLQEKDGSWQASSTRHPAVTSLAVMAYLSAGHVPGEGPYRDNVEKGVRWVLNQQQPNGLFALPAWEEMYQHGICTMMLCEAAAMSDAKTAREIKSKLEKAIKLILQAQRAEKGPFQGGWRYRLDSNDADMSVTGWQLLALRAARNLGCDVPAERIDMAMQFITSCREPRSGGFGYIPGGPMTVACTGTGILAIELCGKERHHSRDALLGGSCLIKNPLKLDDPHFFYSAYYSSQAMFQLGNNYWNVFRPNLHKLLLDGQQRNGGWINNDNLGVSYNTAMAILALTVEYRYLPIYQRNEENEPAK